MPAALVSVLALAVVSASAQPAPPAALPGEAVFLISGRGYGHGVGMSQYGAFGMARAGASYDEILAHYYTGTTLGRVGGKEVRVLMVEGRRAVTVASTVPFTIVDGSGMRFRMPSGPLTLRPDLVLPGSGGPVEAHPPLVVRPGRHAPLSLDGRPYRGRLEIALEGEFLRVVNHVGLEAYLEGAVAGEVPHAWPAEALKAQAVAARSYALATLVRGKPFDLYSDVRSQVYLGVGGEQESTSQAVRVTRGEVVLYAGRVATTYYFSSSGGRTASAADVFGIDVPYLVSRPDPTDRASPYHRWGPVLVGARTLQAKLDVEGRVLDATGVPTPSGRLRSVVIQTPSGSTTLPAGVLRAALGLRSTWVSIGALRLDRQRVPVLFGSTTELTGIARGLPSPVISSSVSGTLWTRLGAVERGAGGALAFVVRPERTLRYRIEAERAASPATLVRVAPRVQLVASDVPGVLLGTVRPRLANVSVAIERRSGPTWVRVANATVDSAGAFRVELGGLRGSFRARVAPTGGYAEGVAPTVTVSP